MKRSGLIGIVFVLWLVAGSVPVLASPGTVLVATDGQGEAGDLITTDIHVQLAAPDQFNGWDMTLAYDPQIARIEAIRPANVWTIPLAIEFATPGTAHIALVRFGFCSPGDSTCSVFIDWRAVGPGTTAITFTNYLVVGRQNGVAGPLSPTAAVEGMLEIGATEPSDEEPPSVQASQLPQPNSSGWNSGPVSVTLVGNDDGGDVFLYFSADGSCAPTNTTSCLLYTDPIELNDNGIHQIAYFAVDAAGNTSLPALLEVRIDTIPPTVGAAIASGSLFGLGENVSVGLMCTDSLPGSGIEECTSTAGNTVNTATVGDFVFTATGLDHAGNVTTLTIPYRVGGKNECKGGGWRLFTDLDFRNQGDCISVNRHGDAHVGRHSDAHPNGC